MDACEILDATVANTVGCAIPGAPGRVGSGVRSTHQHQSFNVFLVDFFDGGLFFSSAFVEGDGDTRKGNIQQ